jgi:hypothetical protein
VSAAAAAGGPGADRPALSGDSDPLGTPLLS